MSEARVFAITQSLISLIVVIGGGFVFFFQPESREAVTGIMGLVIGFYFRDATFRMGSGAAAVARSMANQAIRVMSIAVFVALLVRGG